jgi:PKD repeat protein
MWDFGDGTFSNLENPTHCYANNGVYQVCLTATCPDGTAVVVCTTVTANCQPCPQDCEVFAGFNQSITGKTVSFADNSNAGSGTTITGWFWTFGDGTSSTNQNPVHTYAATGDYVVCLTVTGVTADGTTCTDTYCYVVVVPCVGDLNADGVVNVGDVLIFLAVYNTVCP